MRHYKCICKRASRLLAQKFTNDGAQQRRNTLARSRPTRAPDYVRTPNLTVHAAKHPFFRLSSHHTRSRGALHDDPGRPIYDT